MDAVFIVINKRDTEQGAVYAFAALANDGAGCDYKPLWKGECQESDLTPLVKYARSLGNTHQVKFLNFKLKDKKVLPVGYSFDVFKREKAKPNVLLNEVRSEETGALLGYTIYVTDSGKVANVSLIKLMPAVKKYQESGLKLIHNAMYIGATEGKKEYLKQFIEGSIPSRSVKTGQNTKVDAEKAEMSKEKLDSNAKKESAASKFTAEQMVVLRKAHNEGVNYKKFAKPELSPAQMEMLYEIEKLGRLDSRYLAFPRYSVEVLEFYYSELKLKDDLSCFVETRNGKRVMASEYNIAQMYQIRLGSLMGIDYHRYMNPKLSVREMSNIREALESNLWVGASEFISGSEQSGVLIKTLNFGKKHKKRGSKE